MRLHTQLQTLLSVCALLLTSQAAAQQTIANAQWFTRTVGLGVTWKFYQFDNMFGAKQSVSVLEADLTNPNVSVKLPHLTASRQKTSVFTPAQFSGAAGAVNGTFFNLSPSPGGCSTFLKVNGTVVTPEQQGGMAVEGAMCRSTGNTISVRQRPSGGWSTSTQADVIANGPVVIFNNVIPNLAAYGAHCTARHPRTAVGTTTNSKLLLVTVDGRTDGAAGMTCDELAIVMRDLGCDDAVSLDGGGSTTMWVRGEQNSGVVNYPSDNGIYDHLGERACSNGIAIVSPAAPAVAWDARMVSLSYPPVMFSGTTATVTVAYKNIGTQTWTPSNMRLKVTRPRLRNSAFRTGAGWPSSTTPANLTVPSVVPNATATFSFVIKAPTVSGNTTYYEHFGLEHDASLPFGPPDNEPRMKIVVQLPSAPTTGTVIVESRAGGQNYQWYSEQGGWADVATNCSAPGLTGNIGMRYGSTFLSVAESKSATYAPDFSAATTRDVFVAWGAANSRRSPITYKVTGTTGTATYLLDQTVRANEWVYLGRHSFAAGTGGNVTMSNENIDVSGNMYSAGVKFQVVPAAPTRVEEALEY